MYLRRIDLYGFKSFANESRIELAAGLTTLVGPNGGGKSNVVDAIRWALGEQRLKELRAERWEDLLYAGGLRRRPAQVAEVLLEFDNVDGSMPDWPEVLQVGRRLFRSGESEYLLGSRAVRLKDILDLFLDSGLGRAAYAIIGQGKVEAALLQRPGERLEQLEEAAGTTRYKVRRRETRQRLDQVMAELARASDLEAEVENQKASVAAAAEQEQRYLVLEQEARLLRSGLKAAERVEFQSQVDRIQDVEAAWETERAAIEKRLQGLGGEIETLQVALSEGDQALETMTAQSLDQAKERERWLGRRESLVERQKQLEGFRQDAEQAKSAAEAAFSQDHQQVPAENLDDDGTDLSERLISCRASLEAQERSLAAIEEEQREAAQEAAEAQRRLMAAQQIASHLRAILGEQSQTWPDAIRSCEQRRENAQQALAVQDAEISLARSQLDRLRQYLKEQGRQLHDFEHQSAQRQARYRVLQQLDAEGEGYGHGVRSIIKAQADGYVQGVFGTLGALVRVDDAYVVAVQAALGGAAQDLVVDSEQNARMAIRFLQSRGLGRATFLPLDTIRPARVRAIDGDLVRQEGVVGWALDLVEIADALRPAAAHVLGRVLVTQRLEDAVAVGRLVDFRYRLVTLDGQLVHPGGSITGGSPASNNSAWVRRQEIERLRRRLDQDRDQLDGLRLLIKSGETEQEQLEQRLSQLVEQRITAEQELSSASSRLEALRRVVPEEADVIEVADLALRADIAANRVASLHEAQKKALGAVRRLEQELAGLKAEWSRWEAFRREREALGQRLAQAHERAEQRMVEADRRLNSLSVEIQTAERERLQADQALGVLNQVLADMNHRIAELREGIRHQRAEWGRITESRRLMELELRRGEQRVQALRLEKERLDGQLAVLANDAEALGEPVDDVPGAKRRLAQINRELEQLGPIAPGSLAMFQQLAERARVLKTERCDIMRAVSELEDTILELDREVDERRRSTVTLLEQAFQRAVQELFGGGQSGFQWIGQPDEGIDLWVQPPGKRAQSLQLLSGGEKALGALAWLFALLEIHPAPLVVLDEVEASLDELSARRFAQYLSRRRQSQYLVVTHHKVTMEQADALWGFSSDSHGVTRLASVRLGV